MKRNYLCFEIVTKKAEQKKNNYLAINRSCGVCLYDINNKLFAIINRSGINKAIEIDNQIKVLGQLHTTYEYMDKWTYEDEVKQTVLLLKDIENIF